MNTPDRAGGHAKTVADSLPQLRDPRRACSCAPGLRVVAMIIAVLLAWSRRFALDVSVRLPWAVG
jgi:hypothetical protein